MLTGWPPRLLALAGRSLRLSLEFSLEPCLRFDFTSGWGATTPPERCFRSDTWLALLNVTNSIHRIATFVVKWRIVLDMNSS